MRLIRWTLGMLTAFGSAGIGLNASASDEKLPDQVTFSKHIAPIVFQRCTECHREGEIGPFPLTKYSELRKRGRQVREVVLDRFMPPWHPAPGHGDFRDSRRLSDREIALIDAWVTTGMLEGDPKQMPAMPEFPMGWRLGEPDLVVSMGEGFDVPADGPDIYRNFVLPLDLDEDKWVTSVEIRPGAPAVLHHSLFYLDSSGTARRLDAEDSVPGFESMGFRRTGSLGGWAVGATARKLPYDLALPLPKGSDLVLASHFHPSGKPEHEKSVVGIYFAEKAPERTLARMQVPPGYGRWAGLRIPGGDADFKIGGRFEVPVDVDMITMSAHMHYLGKSAKAWATLPNGKVEPLLFIPNWDFSWQGSYVYQNAVRLPKGSVIESDIRYDNSDKNPNNPFDPPRTVRWGLESSDEMGSVIFSFLPAREEDLPELNKAISAYSSQARRKTRRVGEGIQLKKRLLALDRDGDGVVEVDEIPRAFRKLVLRADQNGDGAVSSDEIDSVGARPGQ